MSARARVLRGMGIRPGCLGLCSEGSPVAATYFFFFARGISTVWRTFSNAPAILVAPGGLVLRLLQSRGFLLDYDTL